MKDVDEYTVIGHVVRDIRDGQSFGQVATDLFLCQRCSAVIADPDDHRRWHERISDGFTHIFGPLT